MGTHLYSLKSNLQTATLTKKDQKNLRKWCACQPSPTLSRASVTPKSETSARCSSDRAPRSLFSSSASCRTTVTSASSKRSMTTELAYCCPPKRPNQQVRCHLTPIQRRRRRHGEMADQSPPIATVRTRRLHHL